MRSARAGKRSRSEAGDAFQVGEPGYANLKLESVYARAFPYSTSKRAQAFSACGSL